MLFSRNDIKNKKAIVEFIILCWMVFLIAGPAKAQTYVFPTVFNPASCLYTYEIDITIKLDSVKVTNIYFDDGTNGSFAFEAYVSYENTFTNSTLPAGNFFTYDISVFSDNANLSPQMLTNNTGNVPLETSMAGGLVSLNNPTYNGSASALNLTLNGVYSSQSILSVLGYDSATLHINLPCLDTLLETNSQDVLPVLWSDITAAVDQNEVLLAWKTFTEQNNLGFTIERSLDGLNWQSAGFINSKAPGGNSNDAISYLYRQTEQFGGQYFYRVIQQDIDGRSMISNVVRISIINQQVPGGLVIYPNPSGDLIYLRQIPPNTKYIISDSYGRIVMQGNYQDRIDVSMLLPGVYWIRVETMVSRFVVMKGP